MKLEDLVSPGIVPNSQRLRSEALKAINHIHVVALQYPDGKVDYSAELKAFFAACAAAVADNVPA